MQTVLDYTEEELIGMIKSTKVFKSNKGGYTDRQLYDQNGDVDTCDDALDELGIEFVSDNEKIDDEYFEVRCGLFPAVRKLLTR